MRILGLDYVARRAVGDIQKELGLPIKFIGLGEQADDLQPFDAKQFAQALFEE